MKFASLLVIALLGVSACHRAAPERVASGDQVRVFLEPAAATEHAPRSVERPPNADDESGVATRVETVHLPAGYHGEPIRVLVGLHGMNANPHVLRTRGDRLATAHHVAIVEVSATVPTGPDRFRWSGDLERDQTRIVEGLARVADRFHAADGCIGLYGFSQGGITAFNLALAHPERYCGAFVMSPGGGDVLAPLPGTGAALDGHPFVVTVGANERQGILTTTDAVREALDALGVPFAYEVDEAMQGHRLHRDVEPLMSAWLTSVYGR